MTRPEFNEWFSKHLALYPGIPTWLGKMNPEESKEIRDTWVTALAEYPAADCRKASWRLYQRDEQPKGGFGDHPRAIMQIIREMRSVVQRKPKVERGEPDCELCNGNGYVQAPASAALKERAAKIVDKNLRIVIKAMLTNGVTEKCQCMTVRLANATA